MSDQTIFLHSIGLIKDNVIDIRKYIEPLELDEYPAGHNLNHDILGIKDCLAQIEVEIFNLKNLWKDKK